MAGGGTESQAAAEEPPPPTPLPVFRVFVVCCILFSDAYAMNQLTPYVAFMIRDEFHMTDNDSEIGYYAGLLTTAYAITSLLSSYPFGYCSDKFGRRPVMLFGLVGTLVCTLAFGLSKSFAMALTVRAAHGLVNGNLGQVTAYLGDITDKSNRAAAFAKVGVTTGLGRIVGPVVGGFFAQPAVQYPSVFGGTIFETYPYLAPALVGAAISTLGLVLGYFHLAETLKKKPPTPTAEEGGTAAAAAEAPEQTGDYVELQEENVPDEVEPVLPRKSTPGGIMPVDGKPEGRIMVEQERIDNGAGVGVAPASTTAPSTSTAVGGDAPPTSHAPETVAPEATIAGATAAGPAASQIGEAAAVEVAHPPAEEIVPAEAAVTETTAAGEEGAVADTTEDAAAAEAAPAGPPQPYWKEKKVLITLTMYGIIVAAAQIETQIYPLFAVAVINFTSAEIGLTMAVGAVVLITQQLTVFAKIVKRYGALKTYRVASGMVVALFFFFPSIATLFADHTITNVLMVILVAWRLCAITISFTTLLIFIANCTVSENLGKVNGLGQTISNAGRVFGPAAGATIFAWSLTNSAWPFNNQLVYLLLGIFTASAFALSFQLDESINGDGKSSGRH